jgi:hypothetical protein
LFGLYFYLFSIQTIPVFAALYLDIVWYQKIGLVFLIVGILIIDQHILEVIDFSPFAEISSYLFLEHHLFEKYHGQAFLKKEKTT